MRFNKIATISLLLFLTVFTPLAFGAVEPWSIFVFEAAVSLIAVLWFFEAYLRKEIKLAKLSGQWPRRNSFFKIISDYSLYALPALFLFLVVLQLIPVPAGLLKAVSSNTYNIENSAFHFAGQTPHFTLSLNANAAFQELIKYLCYFIVFFAAVNEIRTLKEINTIIIIIVTAGFLISIFAIIQKFTWTGKIYGIQSVPGNSSPFGPFVNYDHYAGFINMSIMPGLGMALSKMRSSKRMLIGFMTAVMISSLFLSGSRGGVLSFLGGLLIFAFLLLVLRASYEKKAFNFAFLSLIIIIVLVVLFIYWIDWTTVLERLKTIIRFEKNFLNPRMGIWKDSFSLVRNFPFFGTGIGSYGLVFPMYQASHVNMFWRYAHNDYLQLLIEAGPIALLLVFSFVLIYSKRIVAKIKNSSNNHLSGMLAGCFAAVVTVLIHSFVDFNLHITSNAFLFTLLAGLSVSLTTITGTKKEGPCEADAQTIPPSELSKFVPFFCVSGILFIAFAIIIPSTKQYAAGYYYQKSSAPVSQISSLEKAVSLSPRNAAYHHSLGLAYQENASRSGLPGNEKQALLLLSRKELEKSLILSPSEGKYWASYAWLYGNLNEKEKAEAAFQAARALAPNTESIKALYSQFRKTFNY